MIPDLDRRRGALFIVSAPSGAGKTSIARRALGELGGLRLSVSCTTRDQRPGEKDREDYRFVSRDAFDEMRREGHFAEWAEVHGALYGTPRGPIDEALEAGTDTLLDIDVQGARQISEAYPEAVSVFVLPPSDEELERRLRARGTDSDEVIRRRLARAREETSELPRYDYVIVNHNLDQSVRDFCAIVVAERHRVARLR